MKKLTIITLLLFSKALAQNNQRSLDSLLSVISSEKNADERLKTQAKLVVNYFTAGESEKANKLLQQTESEVKKLHSEAGEAAIYHCKGTLFYYSSEFDSALIYFKKALPLRRKTHDQEGTLKTLTNIGGIYYMLSDLKQAVHVYEEALKLESEWGFPEGKILSFNSLGSIYYRMGMFNKSLYYYKKAS